MPSAGSYACTTAPVRPGGFPATLHIKRYESSYRAIHNIRNICKVSLLCSALYAKHPYHSVLHMHIGLLCVLYIQSPLGNDPRAWCGICISRWPHSFATRTATVHLPPRQQTLLLEDEF